MTSPICKQHAEAMDRALRLSGLSVRTRESYTERLKAVAASTGRCPCQLSEDDILNYFLLCIEKRDHAAGTIRPTKAAVRFFLDKVLHRPTAFLDMVKAETRQRLPEVFSEVDAWRIIDSLRQPHNRACMTLLYTCGLRIDEALHLTIDDFDRQRQEIRVRGGKGGKDRVVPIPQWTLNLLRNYWSTHRNPKWIFPAIGATPNLREMATVPMTANTVRDALKAVVAELRIEVKEVRLHTFRHSYATHLLDAGVNLFTVQRYLGHSDLKSTMVYLHLTTVGQEKAREIIEQLMRGRRK
jgi:integrase/recombinase XerD